MYPLWDSVIAPTLEAAAPRRVVEIGAFQGETTVKLLDLLGPSSELHVIDPVPQFDPAEHERRFAGRYHFHRDISHNVLPTLPPVDAALIDGDHNWYTVYNELKMLAASAREAGAPLPLLFLHDVGWPYGRRDLYYAPERIPEQYRQPYAMKGLRLRRGPKGQTDLLERGGVNPKMNNALHEGGPRNGVMTALEDFMREHDREVRVRVLPIYFSLAIAADEARIAARQALGDALDRLDAPALLRDCLELAERLRLKEMHWGHQVFYTWQDKLERMAQRYLDLLSAQLPARPADAGLLEACLETIRTEKIEGDLMQLGAAADDGAVLMRAFLQAHEISSPSVWVVDPSSDKPSLGELREHLRRFELLDERVRLLAGEARDVLADVPVKKLALLRVGTDADPREALDLLYEKLVPGGYLILEDGGGQDRRRVVNNLLSDDVAEDSDASESGAARWRKVS